MKKQKRKKTNVIPIRLRNPLEIIGDYTPLPNWVLCIEGISPEAKVTYCQILKYSGEIGICYLTRIQLAKDMGTSTNIVGTAINELVGCALIKVEQQGEGLPDKFYILPHIWSEQS